MDDGCTLQPIEDPSGPPPTTANQHTDSDGENDIAGYTRCRIMIIDFAGSPWATAADKIHGGRFSTQRQGVQVQGSGCGAPEEPAELAKLEQ